MSRLCGLMILYRPKNTVARKMFPENAEVAPGSGVANQTVPSACSPRDTDIHSGSFVAATARPRELYQSMKGNEGVKGMQYPCNPFDPCLKDRPLHDDSSTAYMGCIKLTRLAVSIEGDLWHNQLIPNRTPSTVRRGVTDWNHDACGLKQKHSLESITRERLKYCHIER